MNVNPIQPQKVEDILDLLPIVQGQAWSVDKYGQIRNARGQCPLCALASELGENPHGVWVDVASVGWDRYSDAVKAVETAADCNSHPLHPALLAALGMEGA